MQHPFTATTKKTIIAVVLLTIPLMLFIQHGDVVLAASKWHYSLVDFPMHFFNILGDARWFIPIFIVLFLYQYRAATYFGLLIIIQTIIVRFFKAGIAQKWPRPSLYFEMRDIILDPAIGITLHQVDSFPSGHSTTSFTLALFFMAYFKSSKAQIGILIIGCIAAFARVFFAQHFLLDIIAGLYTALITMTVSRLIFSNLKFDRIKGGFIKKSLKKAKNI